MSMGHEAIDNEHKYLFCLVNSVELALKLEDGDKLVLMFVDQLLEYTRKHFIHEEGLQRECQYPLYQQHHQEHQKILNSLIALHEKLKVPKDAIAASPQSKEELKEVSKDETAMSVEDYDPYALDSDNDSDVNTTESDKESEPATEEVVALLRYWILDHVMVSDMKLKKHMQKHS